MIALSTRTDGPALLRHLQRMIRVRWWVIALGFTMLILAEPGLGIHLPHGPLLATLLVLAALNAYAFVHFRSATESSEQALFSQLLTDTVGLGALLYFSGGATNPLISMLLPPIAIAALSLRPIHVLGISAVAISLYSALLFFFLPLTLDEPQRATQLHLTGMWLTFAFSAVLIAWLIQRMTAQIRARDAELTETRLQGMRDEHILALGTLAAGAAHELGTPLSTMAVIAGELQHDPDLSEESLDDIALLRQQIAQCKRIITGLSQRAGADRLENMGKMPVDRWLSSVLDTWQLTRPAVRVKVISPDRTPVPQITVDPRLEQAMHNLLNNAARASNGQPLTFAVNWKDSGTGSTVFVRLRDAGPGFPAEILANAGRQPVASTTGQGLGLMLSRAVIEQMGGELRLSNPEDGGALVEITLPGLAS